jgi:hypothetical protein
MGSTLSLGSLHCLQGSYTVFREPTVSSKILHYLHGAYTVFREPTPYRTYRRVLSNKIHILEGRGPLRNGLETSK